jgi:hypothetical protein
LTLLCGIHSLSTLGITYNNGWKSSQNPIIVSPISALVGARMILFVIDAKKDKYRNTIPLSTNPTIHIQFAVTFACCFCFAHFFRQECRGFGHTKEQFSCAKASLE